jgi:glycosyltransferase involved in cell wall biosynthesis
VKVSVCILAYQHADFIAQSLDSVLGQEGSFELQIILGEDASTDGTREICQEYARRHPDLIELRLQDRANNISIDGRPTGRYNFVDCYGRAQGEFVCFLDGDDFFCQQDRLARQLGFLEAHPECAAVGGGMLVLEEQGWYRWAQEQERRLTRAQILSGREAIAFGAVMYRRSSLPAELPAWFRYDAPVGDVFLHGYASRHGEFGILPLPLLGHRVHRSAVWSSIGYEATRAYLVKVAELLLEHEALDDGDRELLGKRLSRARRRARLVEATRSRRRALRLAARTLLTARKLFAAGRASARLERSEPPISADGFIVAV